MGFADELRGAAGIFGKAAGEAMREGVGRVESWTQDLADTRRMGEFDDKINKAAAAAKAAGKDGTHEPGREPKAIQFDPFDMVSQMGWRERPTPLTYVSMEVIATSVPVVADVINVRTTQVQTFCQRPEDRFSPGLRVRPVDKTKKITEVEKKRMHELEQTLLDCGWNDSRESHERMTLREFCGMFIKDSLTYDQATFEVVPDRKGRPAYWMIVDPTTIRLLDTIERPGDEPFAVQMVGNSIVADFTPSELAFCIRNPRSGIKSYGYGQAEIETLVREITGLLWGIDYNRRFFTNASATKGILNFKGTIPDRHLQAFRRSWYAQLQGVQNSWRTPITNADEIQWINMQLSNKDMEFSAFLDFLIKIVCARYKIAPEVVNFSYGNSGQSQAMGTAPIEEKLKASKDLGLRPLVYWFFQCLNKFWLARIDPDYEVIPVGFDRKSVDSETDLLQKQTKVYMTVDEARELVDLEPLGEGKGDLILDPTWLQYFQSQEAAEEDEGEEGYEEGDEDFGGDEDAGGEEEGDNQDDEDAYGFNDLETGEVLDEPDEGDNDAEPVAKAAAESIQLTEVAPRPGAIRYELDL